jgi:hypothetical protein
VLVANLDRRSRFSLASTAAPRTWLSTENAMTGNEDEDVRTDHQKEWARWAASGYRKRYQPLSVLRIGLVLTLTLFIGLVILFWLAASGRLP